MTTDIRDGLRTKEEYQEAAVISYIPSILALPKLVKYNLDVQKLKFKELAVVDDSVVPSYLTTEMTEVATAKVASSEHVFNSYGKGIKLRKDSLLNSNVNIQTFHDQMVRQLNIHFDQISYIGEGGNNGLITSLDPNYVTKTPQEIPAASGNGFNRIQKAKQIATSLNISVNDLTASDSLTVYFYGSELIEFLGEVTEGQENDVRYHIEQAFNGKNVNYVEISALAVPASLSLGNGIIVVSNDLTVVEHAGLPEISRDGTNEENDYYWANYSLGSVQIRPEVNGSVIKQAITFA